MVNKDVYLKKRLIKHAIIISVILLVLLGGAAVLSDRDDDTQSEKHLKENENNTLRSEQENIQHELGTGFEIEEYYNTYIQYHNKNFVINREAATEILNILREKHHLVNLAVTISPLSDVTTTNTKLKTGVMVKSQVSLTFSALTDNSVYGFMQSLESQLPGIVLNYDLKLSQTGELSRSVLADLGQHKINPLVKGELSFMWFGIRPADATSKGTGNGK